MTIDLDKNRIFMLLLCSVCIALFLENAVLNITLIVFYLFCLIYRDSGKRWKAMVQTPLVYPALLFILYALWVVFSSDKTLALEELVKKSPLFFLPFSLFMTRSRLSPKQVDLVLITFVSVCVAGSLYCYANALVNVAKNNSFYVETVDRRYYYFSYSLLTDAIGLKPIYISMFANLALAIVLLRFQSVKLWFRLLLGVHLFIFIVLISSKIGILIAILLASLYIIQTTGKAFVSLILVVGIGAAVALGVMNLDFLKKRFVNTIMIDLKEPHGHLWNSTAYRVAIWRCAFDAAANSIPFGQGTTDGQKELERVYEEKGFVRGLLDRYNAHNEFLSTTLDLGLPGLAVLCLMFGSAFVKAVRTKDTLFLYFLIIILCTFCIESVFIRLKGIAFVTFFYSFLVWSNSSNEASWSTK